MREYKARALAEVCSNQLNLEQNGIESTRLNMLFADLHELLEKRCLRDHEQYKLSASLKRLASESKVSIASSNQIINFYDGLDRLSQNKISRNLLAFGASLVGSEGTSRLKELGFKL